MDFLQQLVRSITGVDCNPSPANYTVSQLQDMLHVAPIMVIIQNPHFNNGFSPAISKGPIMVIIQNPHFNNGFPPAISKVQSRVLIATHHLYTVSQLQDMLHVAPIMVIIQNPHLNNGFLQQLVRSITGVDCNPSP
ncbi:hypothetical protein J6590_016399 [Homalodisca vitripennis]|nr:hypothetical protein J6590_016399 [Homalodisca vitripennis]